MQVQVPSERLTAQWNLGAWHLTAALRKEPEERPAVVQRLSLRHLGRRDLHGPRRARSDGLAQGGRRRIRPMDVAADGPEVGARPSRMGAARSAQRALLRRARMSDARRRATRRRRPNGRHPCVRPGLDRLGADRTLLADRRHEVARRPSRRGSRPTPSGCCGSGRSCRKPCPAANVSGARACCRRVSRLRTAAACGCTSTNARPTTGSSSRDSRTP